MLAGSKKNPAHWYKKRNIYASKWRNEGISIWNEKITFIWFSMKDYRKKMQLYEPTGKNKTQYMIDTNPLRTKRNKNPTGEI